MLTPKLSLFATPASEKRIVSGLNVPRYAERVENGNSCKSLKPLDSTSDERSVRNHENSILMKQLQSIAESNQKPTAPFKLDASRRSIGLEFAKRQAMKMID